MDFTLKIEEYISNENEMEPFKEKLCMLQSNFDLMLEENKGAYGEYSIGAFDDLLNRRKEIDYLE